MTVANARSARRSTSGTTTRTRSASAIAAGSAVRRGQPGSARPAHQAFRLAEELSVPVMVCMDGFILTHAYERVTCRRRNRWTPTCRRTNRAGARPGRPGVDWRDGGPEAFMEVRYLAHAKQRQALELIPRGPASSSASSAARAADSRIPTGSRRGDSDRRARLGARHHQGHRRRDAQPRREDRRAGITASGHGRRLRCGPPSRRRNASSCWRRARRGLGGIVSNNVSAAYHGSRTTCTPSSPTRRPLDHAWFAHESVRPGDRRQARSVRSSTSTTPSSTRAEARTRTTTQRTDRRSHPARTRRRRRKDRLRAPHELQPIHFYQTGTFTVGNACCPRGALVQAKLRRTNSLNSAPRVPGLRRGARRPLPIDAAMDATNRQLVAANATGCLEVFSTPYPETSCRSVDSLAVRQRGRVATGIAQRCA